MRQLERQIKQFLDYSEKVQLQSPNTIKNKKWNTDDFLASVEGLERIEDLTNDMVNDWIKKQNQRGCSGRTINDRLKVLRTALKYFNGMGIMTPKFNPMMVPKINELPPRHKFYTQEQINDVLSVAKPFEWLVISLAYDCGLRISELRNLRLSNIDGQMITFIGKGLKKREVYISLKTKERLDAYIKFNNITDYLWIGEHENLTKRPITVEAIRQRMTNAFERAGYHGFYPHSLRHSFATNLCQAGAPLVVTQKMLGHNNLATTERYVHAFDGHLKEYFDRYKFQVI